VETRTRALRRAGARAACCAGVHRGPRRRDLRGPTVAADFKKMVIDYIEKRYGAANAGQRTAAE